MRKCFGILLVTIILISTFACANASSYGDVKFIMTVSPEAIDAFKAVKKILLNPSSAVVNEVRFAVLAKVWIFDVSAQTRAGGYDRLHLCASKDGDSWDAYEDLGDIMWNMAGSEWHDSDAIIQCLH